MAQAVNLMNITRAKKMALHDKCKVDKRHAGKTGLQCATNYYIRVLVTGELRQPGGVPATPTLSTVSDMQVFVGGKKNTICI